MLEKTKTKTKFNANETDLSLLGNSFKGFATQEASEELGW
jgi:hypothetical protein